MSTIADQPWSAVPADVASLLEPHLHDVIAEIVAELVRRAPDYAGSEPYLYRVVGGAVQHFTTLIADPDVSVDQLAPMWREIGGTEAAAGHSMERLESANRGIMELVWQRIVGESETYGLSNETLSLLLQSLMAFVGAVSDAAGEGHLRVELSPDDERRHHRMALVRELVREDPGGPVADDVLRVLARAAGWTVPNRLAVVLLTGTEPLPDLPPHIAADTNRRTPCLLLPDPDSAERLAELRELLGGRHAVVGPAVAPRDAARSRRWAAEASRLVRRGILPDDPVLCCVDHVPTLVIFHAEGLLNTAAAQRLRPLETVNKTSRERLGRTLLTLLRRHFNATRAAADLDVHPQTVRLRVQRLEEIFGTGLQDRDQRLELQMLLHASLARDDVQLSETP